MLSSMFVTDATGNTNETLSILLDTINYTKYMLS